MLIARLTPIDAPRYRALMLQAYALEADAFTSTPEERAGESDAWWLRRVADTSGMTTAWGAFHEGELVGCATLELSAKTKTRHKAHLIGMYVDAAHRNLGAGSGLVQAAIAFAKTRDGVRVMNLTVTEGNTAAISLYQRCGFQAFGTEPMAIATPTGYKAKIHMVLQLGS